MSRVSVLIFCIIFLSGCVYRVTDIPSVSSIDNLSSEKIYLDTGGQPNGWQQVAKLATDLQTAGFSPAVVSNLSDAPDGAYIIDEIEPWGKCFSEPMLTVLTLGIIPHIGCEEFGHAFMLHRKGSQNKTHVNAKYTVKVMVGWLTWPAALSSSYSFTSTTPDVQLRDQTPIKLLRKELQNAL